MKPILNRSAARSPATIFSSTSTKAHKTVRLVLSAALALAVWQAAALAVGSELLLASPADVLKRMFALAFTDGTFWATAGYTFLRIAIGFFSGLIAGLLLAALAGRFRVIETLLYPYMITVKSIPVASFVILALIWLTASKLAAFVSFLMVLPVVYTNVLTGIRSADVKLLEMAYVFRVPFFRRISRVWLPQLRAQIISACRIALGLAWKSGVAAELIGYPSGSIGEQLYYAKVYFNTVDLFAWTAFIVLFSLAFEKLFLFALGRLTAGKEGI